MQIRYAILMTKRNIQAIIYTLTFTPVLCWHPSEVQVALPTFHQPHLPTSLPLLHNLAMLAYGHIVLLT